jgi:hypothetical protein
MMGGGSGAVVVVGRERRRERRRLNIIYCKNGSELYCRYSKKDTVYQVPVYRSTTLLLYQVTQTLKNCGPIPGIVHKFIEIQSICGF